LFYSKKKKIQISRNFNSNNNLIIIGLYLIIGELQDTARVDQRLSAVVSNGGDVSPVLDPLLLPI
jgi:hypothetical protein